MLTTIDTAERHIQGLADTTIAWQSPSETPLDSQVWQTVWGQASKTGRSNMAHGWMWCFEESMNDMSDTQTKDTIRYTLPVHQAWLRTIQPYIQQRAFKRMSLGLLYPPLATLFFVNKNADPQWQALQVLWFGTPGERRDMLLTLPIRYSFLREAGNLVQVLGWEIASLPGSLQRHQAAAVCLSIAAGRAGVDRPAKSLATTDDLAWHTLGSQTAAAKLNLSADERLHLFELVHTTPPAVAAAGLAMLLYFHLFDSSEDGIEVDQHTVLGCRCGPNATAYDVLRAWIPQRKDTWDAAESINLSYQEACTLVANEPTPMPSRALPSDITLC